MPRFVILEHAPGTASKAGLHWDFMLESEQALLTWALDQEPAPGIPLPARKLADHRIAYLDYEGAVSGDRGIVRRWDRGSWEWITRGDDLLQIRLAGQRLTGEVIIRRLTADDQRWVVFFSGAPPQGTR